MSSPNGPKPGSTPQDDADLHSNSGNPYNASSPRVDLSASSVWTPAGYVGEYRNPPVSAGNPHSQGADGWDTGAVDFGPLYDDVLASRTTRGNSAEPSTSDVYSDQGYGSDGNGRS